MIFKPKIFRINVKKEKTNIHIKSRPKSGAH